jgi:SAM-dependent methyltransferase
MSSKPDLLERHLRDLPYFRATLRAVEARMMRSVPLPSPVLDLGCGDGHFASVTFYPGATVGIDPELSSLREASRRGAYRLLVQARGDRLPFAVGSFASAFSNSVLEHVEGLAEVMAELSRVLQPGASLAITVPNPGYRRELHVPQLLRRIGLRRIGERYLLAAQNLSYLEFARLVARLAGARPPWLPIPYPVVWLTAAMTELLAWATRSPPAIPLSAVVAARHREALDGSKAVRELGLTYTPLDEAIVRALAWFRQAGLLPNR